MVSAAVRVLVPVDFMPPSEVALEAGYSLARRIRASVHVVHVASLPPVLEPRLDLHGPDGRRTTLAAVALDDARLRLRRQLEACPAPEGVPLTYEVRLGPPLDVIEYVSRGFDFVVVGTTGSTGLDKWLVGSVAERVVRHVDRPVLLARELPDRPQRILVPVDFSSASRAAFTTATQLAALFGSKLSVLHAVAAVPGLDDEGLTVVGDARRPPVSLGEFAIQRAREELGRFLGLPKVRQGIDVDVVTGDPAAQIVGKARAQSVDLVVMGTHGNTEWAWVGIGSTAEQVVRHAPCSVLTTRWSSRLRVGPDASAPVFTEPADGAPRSAVGGRGPRH